MPEFCYPTDWRRYQLSEIAEIRTGVAKGKRNIEDAVELPYLRVANVQAGHLDLFEVKTIAVRRTEVNRYALKKGDVLLTEGGDFDKLGRGTLWQGEIDECLHQNHLFVVRTDRAILLPQYLVWLTNSPIGRQYFVRASKQSTNLASINSTQLKQYPVVIPPMHEQEAIARVIGSWDAGVDQLEKLLRAKRRLKHGLMQQLLTGKRRFEKFNGRAWTEYHLGELFTEREEVGRADLTLLAITADRGVIRRDEVERKDTSPNDKKSYKRIAPGDIGYNTMRMWQGVSAVSPLEGIVSPAYTVCVPGERADPQFMGYLFKFKPVVHLFRRYSQGLVDDTLNLKYHHFAQIKVVIPELEEQRKIAAVFAVLDQEIAYLRHLLSELTRQKRGLMQKLLTGQVRVKV